MSFNYADLLFCFKYKIIWKKQRVREIRCDPNLLGFTNTKLTVGRISHWCLVDRQQAAELQILGVSHVAFCLLAVMHIPHNNNKNLCTFTFSHSTRLDLISRSMLLFFPIGTAVGYVQYTTTAVFLCVSIFWQCDFTVLWCFFLFLFSPLYPQIFLMPGFSVIKHTSSSVALCTSYSSLGWPLQQGTAQKASIAVNHV